MKRLALALALCHVAAGVAAADEPPAWMPSAPPPPPPRLMRQGAQLRHEAGIFGGLALGFIGAGIAVDVVALDVPQGDRTIVEGGGSVRIEHYLSDANWAEFAVGTALIVTGVGLGILALFRVKQARQLVE